MWLLTIYILHLRNLVPFCTKAIISMSDLWVFQAINILPLHCLWVDKIFDIRPPPSLSFLKLHLFFPPLYWILPSRFRSCFKAVFGYPDFIWYLVDTFSVGLSQVEDLKLLLQTVCLALLPFPLCCYHIDFLNIVLFAHTFVLFLSPAFWRMANHKMTIS